MPTIENFEEILQSRIDIDFPDEQDPDIQHLKTSAKQMLGNIKNLKTQLPR